MRKWSEQISPAYMHDTLGMYTGTWFPQMDRCWMSDDGIQVTSRIISTEWGKVEHAAINIESSDIVTILSNDGSRDIPWAIKQQVKNELFGKDRVAIEVFPSEYNIVDVCDVYHLWVLPKGFKMPFGIHPTKDVQCRAIKRGYPKDISSLVLNGVNHFDK